MNFTPDEIYIPVLFRYEGGLTAVIWTDSIQVLIMVIGAFILMVMSKFNKLYCPILFSPKYISCTST